MPPSPEPIRISPRVAVARRRRSAWWWLLLPAILVGTLVGMLVAAVSQTIVTTVLPTIAQDLDGLGLLVGEHPLGEDAGPEGVDLGEVPQQVVGGPVRAGRDPDLGIDRLDHLEEPGGLVLDDRRVRNHPAMTPPTQPEVQGRTPVVSGSS